MKQVSTVHSTVIWLFAFMATSVSASQIAIIFDDIGYSRAQGERVLALPGAVSLAVLPYTPAAAILARRAHAMGKEVLLHQPMESERLRMFLSRYGSEAARSLADDGTLLTSMPMREIQAEFERALQSIPNVVGVNNHNGSALTRDPGAMHALMEIVRKRGLFFIDSRTTPHTIVPRVASTWGVPVARRDVFLDHDINTDSIHAAFDRTLEIARREGSAIAIAHPHDTTIGYLEQRLYDLARGDVDLVPVSAILKQRVRSAHRAAPDRLGSLAYVRTPPIQ